MIKDYKDISAVKKSVEIEVPADEVKGAFDVVTGEFSRQARVPGFRTGKIPLNIARTRFAKEIEQEVIDRLLPLHFRTVITERSVQPVGSPVLKRVDPLVIGSPFTFEAEFEVKPDIALGEYRGLTVTDKKAEIADEEIDRIVERMMDQSSSFSPITDRAAEDGDYAVIDIVSSGAETERRTSNDYSMQLGENAPLPELTENLRGKRAGDTASFEKTYGEDAPNEEVRGKSVLYEVTVKELRRLERPVLDDDFAKATGMAGSLEELRGKIREDLQRHKEQELLKERRQEIGDQLTSSHELEIPQAMLEDELGKSLRNYARFLQSQGVDLEKTEIEWDKVRDEMKPEAEKRVKRGLILEAIAKKENLSASDLEVDAEIRKAATANNREFAEVKHRLRDDGGYEELRYSIMQERALDLLLDEARVVAQ